MPDIPVVSRLTLLLRNCGNCSACCTPLGIDSDGLRKLPGVPCQHLGPGGRGCTIYATRPTHCQRYLCGWRAGIGDDAHRPDKLGIVLSSCVVRAELVQTIGLGETAFLCHRAGGVPAAAPPRHREVPGDYRTRIFATALGVDLSDTALAYLDVVTSQYIVIGVDREKPRCAVGPQEELAKALTFCRAVGLPLTAILDLSAPD